MATIILGFQGYPPNYPVPNPGRHGDFVSILVRDSINQVINPLRVRSGGGFTGLDMGTIAEIEFDLSVTSIDMRVKYFATPGWVELFDSQGQYLQQVPVDASGRVTYAGADIKKLYLISPGNETLLTLLRIEGIPQQEYVSASQFIEHDIDLDAGLTESVCTEVIFGETSTLRAPGAEAALVSGREFIAAVAYNRYLEDPTRFAPRKKPTTDELKDPNIKKHWDLCTAAAASGKGIDVGDCKHFVIWPIDSSGKSPIKTPKIPDSWPYDYASNITDKYGPLKSYSDPLSDKTHIFKYCGVP